MSSPGIFLRQQISGRPISLRVLLFNKQGVEAIHFCTRTFAKKTDEGWGMKDGGFCEGIDEIIERVNKETDIPCVKGSAHLPKEYSLKTWG